MIPNTLHPSYVMVALVLVSALLAGDQVELLGAVLKPIESSLNHVVLISVGILLVIALLVIASPAGKIRLGHADERPHFSLPSWLAMLFAAGMGTGLVFSGFAEPLLHFTNPPEGGALSDARTKAMLITYYHWGLHAWAVYGLAALAVAYFTYVKNQPMLASGPLNYLCLNQSAIDPDTRHKARRAVALAKWLGPFVCTKHRFAQLVDSIAIIAALFGVAASIAQGTWLIERGLGRMFDISEGAAQGWILCAIVLAFMLSSLSGIGRGIKWLSVINIWLAIGLLILVIAVSDSAAMSGGLDYLANYIALLPALSFNAHTLSSDPSWLATWPSAYMIWWVAWTPFVGIFIARISRGYTVRQFMLGVMLAPVAFSLVWFSVFGEVAFFAAKTSGAIDVVTLADMPSISFAVLDTLPYGEFTTLLMMILIAVFLVTSADSGSYILAMFSHDGKEHPPQKSRLIWGVAIALISAWLVFKPDGMPFIRQIIVLTALPFLVIVWLQVLALLKALCCSQPRTDKKLD